MFRKLTTIEDAINEGKNARSPGALLIFATLFEATWAFFNGALSAAIAFDFAIAVAILSFLLWRVWDGKAIASAIALLICSLAYVWIGVTAPA